METQSINTVPFYKLFIFSDGWDKILMVVGSIGAVANGINMPLMAFLFGQLTDAFARSHTHDVLPSVTKVSLKLVYVALGCGAAAFLQVACWMISGERQAARIRNLYLKTILQQDVAFFDKEVHAGEVIGTMSADTALIQHAMGEKVGKFVQLMASFFGGFMIAFTKGWLLTLVMLSSIPPLMISGGIMSQVVSKMASRGQNAYAAAAIVVDQTIGAIRTVASFTGEKRAVSEYNKSLDKAYKSAVHEGLATGLGIGAVMFVMFCSYALGVWYGGKMILEKGHSGGEILTVIVAVITGSISLGQSLPCLTAFAVGRAAAYKMFETINRKPEIDSRRSGKILNDIYGDIQLRDVHFSYPARPSDQIFTGFSLSIPRGSTAALVGQSGSGKSTVISLLERFYDPQSGEVLIDGINLKDFQLNWIRSKIGLVSQEPVLFMGSIKDNIAYGKNGGATHQEIRAAAELANAAKFIDKLPQGLDSAVGEHGTQLSGGQKQRIAIARAILKDPRILLLDEATSALDAESERIVQEALDRIMVNRTTVIVAHRLTTVRNANMIAVIHKGCRLIRRIRMMCFEKVVSMEVGWFDETENSSGVIGARLSTDAATVRALVGDALAQLVQDLTSVTVGLVVAFVACWQLAIVVLAMVPLIVLNEYVQQKFMMGFSADAKVMYEEAIQVANDAVGTIRAVASYCAEEKVMEMYRNKCEGPLKTGMRRGLISGIGFGLALALLYFAYATSFYAGARLVEAGKTTFQDVFRVFFAINMAAIAVSQSGTFAPDSSKAKTATASIFSILDRKSNIDTSDESGTTLQDVKGEIELRHISFKYPTRPNVKIFSDLSLTIDSGKTVAVVGESGSGKSTVISLLQRFYNPDSGVITMDGVDIDKLQLKWLRQQMGLVSQEPILFSGTIRDNIGYGKAVFPSEAEIIAAAELANAHQFISGLQQGYETMVGERGVQLSGGQKQRIAIARAIVKAPKILLLDEATSSLDAESERVAQDAIDRVMVNRTTVVVAHRLSTIKNVDIIALLKNGVIVEKGNHDSLISIKDGFYASLVALHMAAAS
ncbi:P-glycoprotein 21 [Perilla frutescens var. frutescens]|nr:P-glycoprotein 21 [Perilla frutescens var. frutescens]